MSTATDISDAFATVEAQSRKVIAVTMNPTVARTLRDVIHRDPVTKAWSLWGAVVHLDPKAPGWAITPQTPTRSLLHNPLSLEL